MRKTIFAVSMIFIIFFLTITASAFDGKRKGFILGGGIGPGFTSYTQELAGWDPYFGYTKIKSDQETKVALMTNFKIGYAPTDFWELYYTSKVSWFSFESISGDVIIANGISALGVTYYFKPEAPSPFTAGGIGFSTWNAPFESDSDTWIGLGLFAGAGYEFTKHFNIEVDLLWGKPGDSELGIDVSTNALSVKVTVNALAY